MFSDKDYSYHDGIPKQYLSLKNKTFGEWEIPPWNLLIYKEKCIGKGQFGEVYMASWNKTQVVAKVVNPNLSNSKKYLFIQEFDVLTKIHHPNVVQVLGYVAEPFVIVMEYLPNGELLSYISKIGVSQKKKLNICLDILRAFAYLHNRRPNIVIHRDIKPQNVVMSASGRAKIADFGLSRLFKNDDFICTTDTDVKPLDFTQIVGTKRYMAPEMHSKNRYTHKIDIWSAGIIFYELFEGIRYNPENGVKWSKTHEKIKDIIQNKMLQRDPILRTEAIDIIPFIEDIKPYYISNIFKKIKLCC